MCKLCGRKPILAGKRLYCRDCPPIAHTQKRRERRAQLKAQGIPTWRRNGWKSEEDFRRYFREYMQERRAEQPGPQTAREHAERSGVQEGG